MGRQSRASEVSRLCCKKAMSFEDVARVRELMVRDRPEAKKTGPSFAVILKKFEAKEKWQISVSTGESVTVLDKLEDGWWLVDKSCGQGRGPFGLVPGLKCCWTTVRTQQQQQKTPKQPPTLPPRRGPPLPPRTVTPVNHAPVDVFSNAYGPADLEAALAYVTRLVDGHGFTAVPPDNFNDLCRHADLKDKITKHAEHLRKRRDDNTLH